MHPFAQCAGALAMRDPHREYVPLPAFREILRQKIADLVRTKRVQVEFMGDRNPNRLIGRDGGVVVHAERIRH